MTTVADIIDEIKSVLHPTEEDKVLLCLTAEDKILLCSKIANETFQEKEWHDEGIASTFLASNIKEDILSYVILIGENMIFTGVPKTDIHILVETPNFLVFTRMQGLQRGISSQVFVKGSFTSYYSEATKNKLHDDTQYTLNVTNDRKEAWFLKCTNQTSFYKAKDFIQNILPA